MNYSMFQRIKMNVLLEKLLDWQLYSNFIELYNVKAAILDFSHYIEFQKIENNIRIKLLGLGNIINTEKIIIIGEIAAEIFTPATF